MGATYFITGANRGIGFSLTKAISENKDNTVVATTRSFERAEQLKDLNRSNIEIIQLDVTDSLEKQKESLAKLKVLAKSGVDVFIQNAGIFILEDTPISKEPIENFVTQWEGNTLSSIKIYQAIYPYWTKKNDNATKKAVFISSMVGSMGAFGFATKGYGLSKAGLNFVAKHIAFENAESEDPTLKNSVTISVHPGVVTTDMGRPGVEALEFLRPLAITPDQSAEAILKLVGDVKPEQSGDFLSYDGSKLAY